MTTRTSPGPRVTRRWPGACLLLVLCACPIDFHDPSVERRRQERLDADAADLDGDVPEDDGADSADSPCGAFCLGFAVECSERFASLEGCREACEALPDADEWPSGTSPTGDTLDCRVYHLGRAAEEPAACLDADPTERRACRALCDRFCELVTLCPEPQALYGQSATCSSAMARATPASHRWW
jgi:hypothetical protein